MRVSRVGCAAVVLALVCCLSGARAGGFQLLSVEYDGTTYKVVNGTNKQAAAYGSFNDSYLQSGWGELNIETSSSYDDAVQAYAAGYLEGWATAGQMQTMLSNMLMYFFPHTNGQPPSYLASWAQEQEKWMEEQISSNPDDPYWGVVNVVYQQYRGMVDGASASSGGGLSAMDVWILNAVGDLLDLLKALEPSRYARDWQSMPKHEFDEYVLSTSLCSGFVGVTANLSRMFTSHSSWFTFGATDRIYKHYTFDFANPKVSAQGLSFSSYPGFLESLDDFYLMTNGMAMIQTTNNIFDLSLYKKVVPQSLMAWHRVRVANFIAGSGQEWFETFKQHNSGTYNNQYMLVNFKAFSPGQPLPKGLLWVVEQIPGLVVGADKTDILERGYWASYNVPAFKQIYDLSGYPEVVAKHGVDYSYDLAARAQLFRQKAHVVTDQSADMTDLVWLMRNNEYRTDEISRGDPMRAICSRGDLPNLGPKKTTSGLATGTMFATGYGGCYDTKVTCNHHALQRTSFAINGPTRGGNGGFAPGVKDLYPPFTWKGVPESACPHYDLAPVYDFGFLEMSPKQF